MCYSSVLVFHHAFTEGEDGGPRGQEEDRQEARTPIARSLPPIPVRDAGGPGVALSF